ncbi:hypothetical protein SLA2020_213040 [Shorea laevis]
MEEQKNEGHNLPMVIAVKHHQSSSSSRGRVAAELANHFNYFLADHYDVYPFLEKSFTKSLDLDALSFEILYQMASTQVDPEKGVGVGVGVVLNYPFINDNHLKRLSELSGHNMILIQCRSPQDKENQQQATESEVKQQATESEVSGVRKLTVDPMNLFFLEELVSAILPAEKERHLHEFLFFRDTKKEQKLVCKSCRTSTSPEPSTLPDPSISSGPSYQCVECDEYSFHKNCAESAKDSEYLRKTNDLEYLRRKRLPNLSGRDQPDYNLFPEKQKCEICQDINLENCHDCLLETNIKGKYLPIILHHKMHAHPLNLIIMPISYGYEYGCCGCSEIGQCISYRCFDCNFNLHVSCCFLPESYKHRAHRHNLVIASQFQGDYVREEYLCDICRKERIKEHWSYVCEDCKFVAHVACALDLPHSS